MRRNLGLRIALVVVVIALSAWYLYPPSKSINLGLDLQGGIHLVLGVDADKAIEAQVERAGDTVKAELEKRGLRAQIDTSSRHRAPDLPGPMPPAPHPRLHAASSRPGRRR